MQCVVPCRHESDGRVGGAPNVLASIHPMPDVQRFRDLALLRKYGGVDGVFDFEDFVLGSYACNVGCHGFGARIDGCLGYQWELDDVEFLD
mmetsp:Transcript_38845/g.39267  ORF Transcript_38845/g.39267 Transcript_38845/m.39267 type:complete len:91 (+) Transcript_38845:390-662(+)